MPNPLDLEPSGLARDLESLRAVIETLQAQVNNLLLEIDRLMEQSADHLRIARDLRATNAQLLKQIQQLEQQLRE